MEDFFSLIVIIIGIIAAIASSSSKKKKEQARNVFPPAGNIPKPQQAAPASQPVSFSSMLPRHDEPPAVAQPTVHTHLDPDCDVHDATGSLNFRSSEGKDPCHEEQLPKTRAAISTAEQAAQPGITLDWTGETMVKAFVMQEVLTRPCQRRAR